ncbi:MAG: threonine--tRNA ligase [Candidatus Woesearchaeota archaeon]
MPKTKNEEKRKAPFATPEEIDAFRHTTAHILAHAVTELYPDALPAIGPPIENGFYYDFAGLKITPDDFPKIEKKMADIVKANYKLERLELSPEDARKLFSKNPFKLELIDEIVKKGEQLTAYRQGNFIDLCRGGHVQSTGAIAAFKLLKIAGAYWRGDPHKPQLTRIYGTSFPSKAELNVFLEALADAEKRDHRKLGSRLNLFMFSESIGMGLPLWLPNGEIVRNELMKFIRQKEEAYGYKYVWTPHLALSQLYLQSGHLPYYKDFMYPPMRENSQEYYLKPMNCPHHHLIFKRLVTSYRDLPLRLAEEGTVYRKELSGVASGMMRVRAMTQNDAHIYCTEEQLETEFVSVLRLFKEVYDTIGISDFWFRLSLPDFEKNPEKYASGDRLKWEATADAIRKAMSSFGAKYVEAVGEAAFYGPKIDVQIKNVYGHEETIATAQIDFIVPTRMGLEYVDEHDNRKNPIVIHRAIYGSYERFFAHLIEHFAGKFPLWLSPEQARIITVSNRFDDYAKKVHDELLAAGIRVRLDLGAETLNKKIRNAQLDYVPYILVVGEKEATTQTVNVRTRDNVVHGTIPTSDFIKRCLKEISDKK